MVQLQGYLFIPLNVPEIEATEWIPVSHQLSETEDNWSSAEKTFVKKSMMLG